MRTPHSSTNKGKRVKITTRSGHTYVGKFKEKKGDTIYLENNTVSAVIAGRLVGEIERKTFPMREVRASISQ